MWDQEFKRKPAVQPAAMAFKAKKLEIPDVSGTIAKADAVLDDHASKKILNKPVNEWTKEEILTRIQWLKDNQPMIFIAFIITGCGCFLEGKEE